MRQFRRVRRDKKTGVPSKYLTGARNRSAKAKEIKETAEKLVLIAKTFPIVNEKRNNVR